MTSLCKSANTLSHVFECWELFGHWPHWPHCTEQWSRVVRRLLLWLRQHMKVVWPWVLESECCCHPKICVGILTARVMVLEGGAFGRCLGHEVGLPWVGLALLWKRRCGSLAPSALWGYGEECAPVNRAGTCLSDFWLPELSLMPVVSKLPRLWYFVIAA